jgi:uncharacterized transporter YbjL
MRKALFSQSLNGAIEAGLLAAAEVVVAYLVARKVWRLVYAKTARKL